MNGTTNLNLPYIVVGQAQKEEAHNNALDIIDTAIKSLQDVDTATDLRLDALETFKESTATTLTELDQRLDTLEAGGGGGGEVTRLEFEQLQTEVAAKADATATSQALSQKADSSAVSQALSEKVDVSTYNNDMTTIDSRLDTLENSGGGGGGSGGSSDPSVQVFNFTSDPSTIFNFDMEAGKRCLIVNDTNTLLTSDKNIYITPHSSDNVVNKAYYFILINNTNFDLKTNVKNYGINNNSSQDKSISVRKKSFKQLVFINSGSGIFYYENDVYQDNPSFLILNNYVLSSDTISLSLKSGINKLRVDNNGTITNEFKLDITLQSITSNYYQLVLENNTDHDMHVYRPSVGGYITVNKKSIKLLQVSDRLIFDLSESESETLKIDKISSPATIYKIFPKHAKSIYFKNSYDNAQDVTLYLSDVKTFSNTEVVGEILVFNSTAGALSVKIESGSGTFSVPAGQLKKMYYANGNIVALNT